MTKSLKLTPKSLNKSTVVGVFDSGIGGLSILKEIHKLLPYQSTVYLADQANFPYGSKTSGQIKNIAYHNVETLLKFGVRLVVIACNTATVHAISFLREKFPQIIFIGTEPAVKPAGLVSKKGIIVLCSPQATKSYQLASLLNKYTKNIESFNLGSLSLVKAIEGESNDEELKTILHEELPEEVLSKADVLVLGCTHFPLAKKLIQEYVGNRLKVLDSGEAVAKRAQSLLKKNYLLSGANKANHVYLTTGTPGVIFGYKFDSLESSFSRFT